MGKYPDGRCEVCGKKFPRPNKFRTETESYHEKGCRLNEIKELIESGKDYYDRYEMIDDLKNISKISSFGARIDKKTNKPIMNKYYTRMLECNKLIKNLESHKN